MTQALDSLLDGLENHLTKVMVGSKDEMHPFFECIDETGKKHMIMTAWNNDNEKEELVAAIKRYMRKVNALAFSFVTETWFAKEQPPGEKFVRPSLRPDRSEGILAMASDGHDRKYRVWHTHRDADGYCNKIVEQDVSRDQFTSPMFDNMLG